MRQTKRRAVKNLLTKIVEALIELPVVLRALKERLDAISDPHPTAVSTPASQTPRHEVVNGKRVVRAAKAKPGSFHDGKGNPSPVRASRKLTPAETAMIRKELTGRGKKARRQLRKQLATKFGVTVHQVAAVSAYLTGKLARKFKQGQQRRAAKAQTAKKPARGKKRAPRTSRRRS